MTPPSSRTRTAQAPTIIRTVRRSRLFCAFWTSATRALRPDGSLRWGRLEVGRPEDCRPEPAAGRAEDFPDEVWAEPFEGGLVGGFLATVSFGAVRWRATGRGARDYGRGVRRSVGRRGARTRNEPTTSRAKCTFQPPSPGPRPVGGRGLVGVGVAGSGLSVGGVGHTGGVTTEPTAAPAAAVVDWAQR